MRSPRPASSRGFTGRPIHFCGPPSRRGARELMRKPRPLAVIRNRRPNKRCTFGPTAFSSVQFGCDLRMHRPALGARSAHGMAWYGMAWWHGVVSAALEQLCIVFFLRSLCHQLHSKFSSVRTQPPTATGAPSQTSTMPWVCYRRRNQRQTFGSSFIFVFL